MADLNPETLAEWRKAAEHYLNRSAPTNYHHPSHSETQRRILALLDALAKSEALHAITMRDSNEQMRRAEKAEDSLNDPAHGLARWQQIAQERLDSLHKAEIERDRWKRKARKNDRARKKFAELKDDLEAACDNAEEAREQAQRWYNEYESLAGEVRSLADSRTGKGAVTFGGFIIDEFISPTELRKLLDRASKEED